MRKQRKRLTRKRNVKQTTKNVNENYPIPLPRSMILSVRKERITFSQPVYSRTGTTTLTFSSSIQLYYMQFGSIIGNSAWFLNTATTSGTNALYEYIMIPRIDVKWMPALLLPIATTFGPTDFNLRYMDAYADDSVLPSGYQTAFIPTTLQCLIQQTSKPQGFSLQFPNTFRYGQGGFITLGQMGSTNDFLQSPIALGGMLVINQPLQFLNSTGGTIRVGQIDFAATIYLINTVL